MDSKKDLYSSIKLIVNISKLLCLLSLEVGYVDNKIVFEKLKSKSWYRIRMFIYSVIVLSATTYGQFDFIVSLIGGNKNNTITSDTSESNRLINMLIQFANINMSLVLVVIFNLTHVFDHDRFITAMNDLVNFQFDGVRIDVTYRDSKVFAAVGLSIVVAIIVLKLTLLMFVYSSFGFGDVIIAFVSVHIPLIFISTTLIQWFGCLFLIRKYLKLFRKYMRINPIPYDYCRKLCERFYLVSVGINEEFSLKIFVLISLLFISITAHAFYSVQTFISRHEIRVIPIVNLVVYSAQIFVFIIPCVSVQEEFRKIVRIVSKSKERNVDGFLIQAYFQRPVFNAIDTYKLDGTFIFAVSVFDYRRRGCFFC